MSIMLMQKKKKKKCSHQTFRSLMARQQGAPVGPIKTTPGCIYMEKGAVANGCTSVGLGVALNMLFA